MTIRPFALAVTAVAVLAASTGCKPVAGASCDPKKDSSYFSSHTEHGKSTTTQLECKRVGPDRYEWVKV